MADIVEDNPLRFSTYIWGGTCIGFSDIFVFWKYYFRNLLIVYNFMNHYIYCLESQSEGSPSQKSVVLSSLENLATQYGITNVYATFDSIESFEGSISTLLYEDRFFKDYGIIYLVLEGRDNQLQIDNYYYSLEEIAEFFEGKLTDKILHFANSMSLDLEEETFQYFLDVTGAKAISGYVSRVPVVSTSLDNLYFSLLDSEDSITEVVVELHEEAYVLCKTLGFRVYYGG